LFSRLGLAVHWRPFVSEHLGIRQLGDAGDSRGITTCQATSIRDGVQALSHIRVVNAAESLEQSDQDIGTVSQHLH
jgi:hypothetical protein